MLKVSKAPADLTPVVIAVAERDLAVSLEMFIQALGLEALIHDPDDGLSALPLGPGSTLIIDRQLIEDDARRFIRRLRGQLWVGQTILLIEDGAAPEPPFDARDGVAILEKPFVTAELVAVISRGAPGVGDRRL
jgi:DNA-binding response OmpR family regulator